MSRYGRLANRFVSWLDQELAAMAAKQPKQTPDQIMNQLRKNPRVSMEEVSDRGLDSWLGGQNGTVSLADTGEAGTLPQWQRNNPVPWAQGLPAGNDFAEYATPGLTDYRNTVMAGNWTQREGSPQHFPGYAGYQYHTRGGWLPNSTQGKARVLDEVQSDISQNMAPQFDPHRQQPDNAWDANDVSDQLGRIFADPPVFELHEDPADVLPDARSFLDELDPGVEGYDLAEDLVYNLEQAMAPHNVPARTRYEWQGMARALDDAIAGDADALVWPSADVQYSRYFGDDYPEDFLGQEERALAGLQEAEAAEDWVGITQYRTWAREARARHDRAVGSRQMYTNQYDRRMPRDKRWKQLGLTPELVDLGDIKPINPSNALSTQSQRNLGKYWTVKLTPEVKEKLAREGIPYYAMGGLAVLGTQDGAFDDGT